MFKKATLVVPVLAGLFLMQACQDKTKKGEFSKTANGLEYQLFGKGKDGKYEPKEAPKDTTNTVKVGQVISMQQIVKDGKDSLLFSTYTDKRPAMALINPSPYKASMEEALLMLSPGDSAVFRISADSLFAKSIRQPMPHYLKKGSFITYYVKVEKVQSQQEAMMEQQKMQAEMQAEMQKEMMAAAEKQNPIDAGIIEKYAAENKLNVQKTPSGLAYVITKKGTGPTPKAGQVVSVLYRGTTLDGKEFDSSAKNGGQPFQFPLGQGRVIAGWDEAIALLNKGSKATLLIPSSLGYGTRGAGEDIPANAVLRFDVELVDMK